MSLKRPTRCAFRKVSGTRWRLVLIAVSTWTVVTSSPEWARAADAQGRSLYLQHCAACHGLEGRGDGPNAALFLAKPRDLHEGFLDRYPTDDLVRRVRSGRSIEPALYLPALRARATEVEVVVAYMKRLSSIDWMVIDEGWGIYSLRCQECHGPFGQPTRPFPSGVRAPRDFADQTFQRSISDDDLLVAVRHGRKGMPAAIPRVTEEEARLIVAFIRQLSPGFTLYTQYCAACHGTDGHPIGSFHESAPPPDVVFDQGYFARKNPEALREAVWHMVAEQTPSMPHFRNSISDAEARAIIEYLKAVGPAASGGSPEAPVPLQNRETTAPAVDDR